MMKSEIKSKEFHEIKELYLRFDSDIVLLF